MLRIFALILLASCSSHKSRPSDMAGGSSTDAALSDGGLVISGDLAGVDLAGTVCVPDQNFCVGSVRYTCMHDGKDSVLVQDCAQYSSATNPTSCSTTCRTANATCCASQKPTVEWAFTSPALSGSYTSASKFSSYWLQSCGTTTVNVTLDPTLLCSGVTSALELYIGKGITFTVGTSITMPNTNVTLSYKANANGTASECSEFSGTIMYASGAPTQQLVLDLTCTSGALANTALKGTITANQ